MEDSTKMALRKETNYDASWDVVTSSSFSTDPVLVGPPGGDTGSWVGEAEEFEEFSSTDWEISEGSIHLDPVLAQELDSPGMSNSWFLERYPPCFLLSLSYFMLKLALMVYFIGY